MKIIKKTKLDLEKVECIVIPVFKNIEIKKILKEYPEIEFFFKRYKFKGKIGENIVFNSVKKKKLILVIGAGDFRHIVDARKLSKNIILKLKESRLKSCVIQFIQETELKWSFYINFLDFLFINNYKFKSYLKDKGEEIKKINIFFDFKNRLTNHLIKDREQINECVELVRDLVNEIPAKANPDYMVDSFKKIAKDNRMEIVVLREKDLKEKKFNGVLSVGKASPFEPALIKLSHIPPQFNRTVTVVGKGITFDSGGLNIKTGNHMGEMKSDMAGAAVVLGIAKAVSELEIPVKVHAIAAIAENMPGQEAYKPGDIITYKNKKTVEVVNTDAEGRLALADALLMAAEDKSDYIVEFSTLTGAIVVALGDIFAGLMSQNKKLVSLLLSSGRDTGEYLWEMPMFEDFRESIKSKMADLKNANYKGASSIKAGMFLEEFTGKIPFAHIDIAGTAFLSSPNSFYNQEGATGYGVRLILDFLKQLI